MRFKLLQLCSRNITSPPFRPLHSALLSNIWAGLMKRPAREVAFNIKGFNYNLYEWGSTFAQVPFTKTWIVTVETFIFSSSTTSSAYSFCAPRSAAIQPSWWFTRNWWGSWWTRGYLYIARYYMWCIWYNKFSFQIHTLSRWTRYLYFPKICF